jgi:tetratricopeptide (TPR) repeat protein
MRASTTSSSSALVGLIVIGLAVPVLAAPRPRDDDGFQPHYQRAAQLYNDGRFFEALQELEAAYKIRQWPRLLYNIAQTHRKLGNAREALGYYERYLQADPDAKPEIRAEVEEHIARLRGTLPPEAPAVEPPPRPAATPRPAPPASPAASVSPAPLDRPQVVGAAPAMAERTPVWRRWWLWTTVSLVAAGAAAGIGLGLALRPSGPPDPSGVEIRTPSF